jgi:MYXO-CTERM domain-containing protein
LSGGTIALLLALALGAFAVWRRRPERSRVWHAASRHPSTGWSAREPVSVGSSIFDQDEP